MKLKRMLACLTSVICMAGSLAAFPQMAPVQAKAVVYDSFDRNYDGWHGSSDDVNVEALDCAGIAGTRAIAVTGRKTAADGAMSTKGLYLFGDINYTYSAKVKADTDQTFRMKVRTLDLDTDAETIKEIAVKAVKAGEWTELKADYKAPANSYEFEVTITTDSTEDFMYDEFSISTMEDTSKVSAASASDIGLKDEFGGYFRVGNILNGGSYGGTIKDSGITGNILKDCTAVECENETKPDATLKAVDGNNNVTVSLDSCSAIMDFCVKNNLGFRGHTMVWHSQMPEFFFKRNGQWVDKNTMNARMESYIKNMFGAIESKYPDLDLYAYDVCNECVSDDGNRTANAGGAREPGWGNGKSPWVQIYGDNSFVEQAFRYARQYAPEGCDLYYNDYNEYWDHKRDCIYNMCKSLYQKGLLDGVGMQSHISAQWDGFTGVNAYTSAMKKYLSIGCDVQITELDISLLENNSPKYSYTDQANKYAAIFQAAVDWNTNPQSDGRVTLVQIWGPNDAHSWLKSGSNALLYDSNNNAKECYKKLMSLLPESQWKGPGQTAAPTPVEPDENGFWLKADFENGMSGFTGRGAATAESSSSQKVSGSKSMFVSGRTAEWNGAGTDLSSRIFKAGETYSFSADVMYPSGEEADTFYLSLQYTGSDGETHYAHIAEGSAAKGEWVQLTNESYKLPEGASNFNLYLEMPNSTSDFYVDDVIVAEAGTKIDGPGASSVKIRTSMVKGDVDGDGIIDIFDLAAAKRGMLKGFASTADENCADIDENGKVELADLIQLQKWIHGLITEFTVVEKPFKVVDGSSAFSSVTANSSWKHDGENNPLTTQRFGADPGWMVYGDELYLYTTNDAFEYYKDGRLQINTYNSGAINCISSPDLVNWTDHGAIPVAGRDGFGGPAAWASRAWAPDAAWKTFDGKDKFFLYFANNGSGVGVLRGDSPWGPFEDPIKKELANGSVPGGQGVLWQFDPGVYYDPQTDTGIITYGGGVPEGKSANPGTGRIGKLGKDMISIDGGFKAMQTPYLFEDSSLIKIGDTWYYSYCTNWSGGGNVNGVQFGSADICYMTSKDPMNCGWSGSDLKGVVFKNTGSQRIDNGGNNHHSIIEFKGKYYVAYHSRQQALRMGITAIDGAHPDDRSRDSKDGNYRSTQLNEAVFEPSTGKITCNGDMKGITTQLEALDPYKTVQAETMSNQSKKIKVQGVGDTTVVGEKGEWTKVSGVNFANGAKGIKIKASSKSGCFIKITTGKVDGDVLAYAEIPAGGTMTEETFSTKMNVSGKQDVYFEFSGDITFDCWSAVVK